MDWFRIFIVLTLFIITLNTILFVGALNALVEKVEQIKALVIVEKLPEELSKIIIGLNDLSEGD